MSSDAEIAVLHNEAESRFEATVDGHLAECEYLLQQGTIVFTHTFVPPELRGRGIAEKLARTALEYARQQRLAVVPACSYLAAYVRRHPEYASLLA